MLTLRLPRELKSPNKWQGRHWRYKHRETLAWESEIKVAALLARRALDRPECAVRVAVTRIVPSRRNFIKDDDNLRFATKPLNDALKRLGAIRDDSRLWLQQAMPTQEVSAHGTYETIIEIGRLTDDGD